MVASRETDIPIACNPQVFTKEELQEHISLGLDVLFRLPKDKQELSDGFIFEYRGNEGLFFKVARFVANEHRCCPWGSFAIEMEPFPAGSEGVVRLRYSGGSQEGKAILVEAMDQIRPAAYDPEAEQRLRAAISGFGRIDTENKASFYQKVSESSHGPLGKLK